MLKTPTLSDQHQRAMDNHGPTWVQQLQQNTKRGMTEWFSFGWGQRPRCVGLYQIAFQNYAFRFDWMAYWDGRRWHEHIHVGAQQFVDPAVLPTMDPAFELLVWFRGFTEDQNPDEL